MLSHLVAKWNGEYDGMSYKNYVEDVIFKEHILLHFDDKLEKASRVAWVKKTCAVKTLHLAWSLTEIFAAAKENESLGLFYLAQTCNYWPVKRLTSTLDESTTSIVQRIGCLLCLESFHMSRLLSSPNFARDNKSLQLDTSDSQRLAIHIFVTERHVYYRVHRHPTI